MTSHDRSKYQERQERQGDRAVERPEVLGHDMAGTTAHDEAAGTGHPSAEAAEADEAGAEVEGHLIGTNPYLIERQAHAKQQDFRVEAERQRRAKEAAGGRGMIDRVKDTFRGSSG